MKKKWITTKEDPIWRKDTLIKIKLKKDSNLAEENWQLNGIYSLRVLEKWSKPKDFYDPDRDHIGMMNIVTREQCHIFNNWMGRRGFDWRYITETEKAIMNLTEI